MIEPVYWVELRELSLKVSAAHIAMVAFLEEAAVPWSDDQMVEFKQLILAERIALRAYSALHSVLAAQAPAPVRLRLVVGE